MKFLKPVYRTLFGTWPRRACTTGVIAAAATYVVYVGWQEAEKTRPGYGSSFANEADTGIDMVHNDTFPPARPGSKDVSED